MTVIPKHVFLFLLLASAFCARAASPVAKEPKLPWQIIATPSFPSGVAMVGEKGAYTIAVTNTSKNPGEATVTLTGQVPGEDVSVTRQWEVKLAPGASQDLTWEPDTSAATYLVLNISAESSDKVLGRTVGGLLVVPPQESPLPAKDSFFGTMILRDPAASERLGIRVDRAGANWSQIQIAPGQYDWEKLDQRIAERAAANIGVILDVRPTGGRGQVPKGVAWKSCEELSSDKYLPEWSAFVRAVAERYKDKILALELMNEPNLMCDLKSTGAVPTSTIYAHLLKAGYAASKSVAPDLPVIGLSIAGGDIPEMHFSQQVLDLAPGSMDIIGGHPYTSSRYLGQDARPLSPLKMGAIERIQAMADFMRKNGLKPRVWPTELGWAIHYDEPLTTASARLFAAYTAQALALVRSVPEAEKLCWFASSFPVIERGSNYGMFRKADEKTTYMKGEGNWYPSPSAAAYATCARMLDDVSLVERLKLGTLVHGLRFADNKTGNDVVMLWVDQPHSTGGSANITLPEATPMPTRVVDAFGRELAPDMSLSLEPLPLFLVIPHAQGDGLAQGIAKAKLNAREALTLEVASVSAKDRVSVDAINNNVRPMAVKIYAEGQQSKAKSFQLEPGVHTRDLSLPLELNKPVSTEIVALNERTGQKVTTPLHYFVRPLPKVESPADLERTGKAIVLDQRNQVLPADPGVDWRGPSDLSVRAWAGWTPKGIALLLKVTDETHVAPPAQSTNIWKYDSVQVAFDMSNRASFGFNESCYLFTFGLSEDGPVAREDSSETISAETAQITREGNITTYSLFFPWEWIGGKPLAAGDVFRMNFIANEEDGKGRECWMGLTPGIGEAKLPGAYNQWLLQ